MKEGHGDVVGFFVWVLIHLERQRTGAQQLNDLRHSRSSPGTAQRTRSHSRRGLEKGVLVEGR